jgi:2-methylcitrate dehydratase PrpD
VPGCRWTQAPLQTVLNMIAEYQLVPDQIAEIDIRTFDKASQLDNQRPANIEEAEYSIPYVLGAAIIEGEFGPDQLQSEKLSDSRILEQAKKIKLSEEPRFSEQYPKKVICEVSIKTKEGEILSAINEKIDGDWDVTLSDDQLKDKFTRFATKRLTGDQINRLVDQILSIESVTSIKKFIEMLNMAVI